jgi:hypothetical protein
MPASAKYLVACCLYEHQKSYRAAVLTPRYLDYRGPWKERTLRNLQGEALW